MDLETISDSFVFPVMIVIGVAWIAIWLFIYWRRKASNLTIANKAKVQKDAPPDFLKVDHKKREEAIARGEAYEEVLTEREEAEAQAAADAAAGITEEVGLAERISRMASTLFAVFTLLVTLVRAFGDVQKLEDAGSTIGEIVTKHPIAFLVAAFVVGFQLVTFFTRKKWKDAHAKK
jgi:hypothetical protein